MQNILGVTEKFKHCSVIHFKELVSSYDAERSQLIFCEIICMGGLGLGLG